MFPMPKVEISGETARPIVDAVVDVFPLQRSCWDGSVMQSGFIVLGPSLNALLKLKG